MDDPVRALLISGSVRQISHTRALTEAVDQRLIEHGALTIHWSLKDRPLPIADPRYHHDPSQHPDETVRDFVACANDCNAFVWSSPIYHNSYSAVLKNALDHLSIPCVWYKPIALVSHGGHRSTQAVDQLRTVARGLQGVAVPSQICTSDLDYAETGGAYELRSEDILFRIGRTATELTIFAQACAAIRTAVADPNRRDQP